MKRTTTTRRARLLGPVLFVVAGLLGVAAAFWNWTPSPTPGGLGAAGAPFTLIDVNGVAFESRALHGRPQAIFFGYTHCPDVCPTALLDISQALKTIGAAGDELAVIFISVDPGRDTPDVMKRYVEAVDPRIIGLTGPEADIARVAGSFRVFYRQLPGEGGAYAVDHSAVTYLIGRDGRLVNGLMPGDPQEAIVAKLRKLLAQAGPARGS